MYESDDLLYTPEQLEELLARTKKFLDRAYIETKIKYGYSQANIAMTDFFTKEDYGSFTGSKTRNAFGQLIYHGTEIHQMLFDYALSSYILDKQSQKTPIIISLDEIHKYVNEDDPSLDYSPKKAVEVVALSVAENAYHASNLISCNKKLKNALIQAFVSERYNIPKRKQELDNTPKTKTIKTTSGKYLNISKRQLNKDINNMIRDDDYGIGYFNPEKAMLEQSESQGKSR